MVAEKKADILARSSASLMPSKKSRPYGKDLLSLLVQSNLDTNIPEGDRMTDEEILSRTCCA